MRLLLVPLLLAVFFICSRASTGFVCSRASTGPKSTPEQPDISRSGGVPRRDRLACVPRGVSTIQIVRVIKKYLADNPEKAHRPTRYIASLALAGAFPCKAGK